MTAQELLDLFDKAVKLLEEDNKKKDKEYHEMIRRYYKNTLNIIKED